MVALLVLAAGYASVNRNSSIGRDNINARVPVVASVAVLLWPLFSRAERDSNQQAIFRFDCLLSGICSHFNYATVALQAIQRSYRLVADTIGPGSNSV